MDGFAEKWAQVSFGWCGAVAIPVAQQIVWAGLLCWIEMRINSLSVQCVGVAMYSRATHAFKGV